MTGRPEDDAARRRAERRAFIRSQHPDAGGDPDRFIAGLARLDGGPDGRGPAGASRAGTARAGAGRTGQHPAATPADGRARVYRSRRPDRLLQRTVKELRRRLAGTPPRDLK